MTESVAGIYARMAVAVPFFDNLSAYPDTVPAVLMTDPQWLAARVADTAERWGSADSRVNGTLWVVLGQLDADRHSDRNRDGHRVRGRSIVGRWADLLA